jgi:hypothetical protein
MNKKGDFGWEEISRILLVLMVLLVLIILMSVFRDKGSSIVDSIKSLVRFG